MKNFKLSLLSIILTIFMSCTNNLKENKIVSNIEPNSNFGRFLSTRYSLKVGDSDIASKIISKSKNLHLDLTLAKLNFNSYLINGNFDNAKKFKLIAPSKLKESPMYDLPDFVISLKNKNFLSSDNTSLIKNKLPGFRIIFEKINYIKLVENNDFKSFDLDLTKSNIFNLLIFENTKYENQIYSNIKEKNLSLIESILYFGYLKRKYPKKFDEEIINFSVKFNFNIKYLKLYFENEKSFKRKPSYQLVFANLFSYLSFVLSSKKHVPNSYLKILNEISYYLEPSQGNSNYFLAEIYSNEKNHKTAISKLNRINENSFLFLKSKIKKYKILKIIDKNEADLLLKSIHQKYPNNNDVLFLIANNYRDQNKCDKAINIYNNLIKKSFNKDNFYYLKAICLEKLNKWKDSKKILLDLISRNPRDTYILNYLSYSMAIRNENLIEAKRLIIKALEIEKNNGFFLDTLGWIQFKLNKTNKAIRTIQLAIELEPNNSEIIDHLGDIYHKAGRTKEAINEWTKALTGNGNDKLKKEIRIKLNKYSK